MKKILYLEHPQVDLNSYNIYKGLCEFLGEENVIDFPYKRIYRGEEEYHNDSYLGLLRRDLLQKGILPYGIPPFQPNEDFISGWPHVGGGYSHYIPKHIDLPGQYPLVGLSSQGREYSEDQIIEMLRNGIFSCIVLSTSHRVPTVALARLRDAMGGLHALPPIIYTDHGERDELNEHWAHVFNPILIFKCILTEEVRDSLFRKYGWHHVHPLPNSNFMLGQDFGSHFKIDTDRYAGAKVFDVYYEFLGKDYREVVIDSMKEYCNAYKRFSYPQTADYRHYLSILACSKIAVTHRGICKETLRYWDISMFPTLMICDGTMGAIHPYPFEDGKHAIHYNDNPSTIKHELTDKCEFYLRNDSERMSIAHSGMEHLRRYHTNRARAEYMVSMMKRYGVDI